MGTASGWLTLKVTFFRLRITRKGCLGLLLLELVEDFPVRNIAHLEVLLDELSLLEAHASLPIRHHRIASVVRLAHIAVYSTPSIFALTRLIPSSWCSVSAVRQRATERLRAIFAPETRRTNAFSVRLAAGRILLALEVLEVAVEAGRTAIGSVSVYGEERARRLSDRVVPVRLICRGGPRPAQHNQQDGFPSGRRCHGAASA